MQSRLTLKLLVHVPAAFPKRTDNCILIPTECIKTWNFFKKRKSSEVKNEEKDLLLQIRWLA